MFVVYFDQRMGALNAFCLQNAITCFVTSLHFSKQFLIGLYNLTSTENVNTRMEGHIVGFDEYMNLVLDEACEVHIKNGTKKQVGRIMLKGDNITLIQSADGKSAE